MGLQVLGLWEAPLPWFLLIRVAIYLLLSPSFSSLQINGQSLAILLLLGLSYSPAGSLDNRAAGLHPCMQQKQNLSRSTGFLPCKKFCCGVSLTLHLTILDFNNTNFRWELIKGEWNFQAIAMIRMYFAHECEGCEWLGPSWKCCLLNMCIPIPQIHITAPPMMARESRVFENSVGLDEVMVESLWWWGQCPCKKDVSTGI